MNKNNQLKTPLFSTHNIILGGNSSKTIGMGTLFSLPPRSLNHSPLNFWEGGTLSSTSKLGVGPLSIMQTIKTPFKLALPNPS